MTVAQLLKTVRVNGSRLLVELFGGLMSNGANVSVATTLTYGVSIAIDASLGNSFVVSITDAVARDKYGITRLAARIHDLRYTYGAHIYGQPKRFKTRLGRIGRYEQYRIGDYSRLVWREAIKGAK